MESRHPTDCLLFTMTKSFGEHFLEHFCKNGLTPPIVARATNVWLGELEEAMVYNKPSRRLVDNLADLSKHAWLFGVDPLAPETISGWVAAWDAASPKDRTTVTASTWEEPRVLTTPDYDARGDVVAWLRENPAFTMDAFKATWRVASKQEAEDTLFPARWYPSRETYYAEKLTVWRWNPLKHKRPFGRPDRLIFEPSTGVSMQASIVQALRDKLKKILDEAAAAGVKQVKIQEVAQAYHGREITNPATLQKLRNAMVECGWEYNMYDKVWRPKP